MKKGGRHSKTTLGGWDMMTRKFILHFEHSVSQAEVVNNVSCPRQQYFIMMLLSSRAVFAMVLCDICILYMLSSVFLYVCVCCACLIFFSLNFLCYVRIYDVIYQYFLTSPIDKWLTQKKAHRHPNYISDKENVSTHFVLTQQQQRQLLFDLHK